MDKQSRLKNIFGISLIMILMLVVFVFAATIPTVTLESPASGTYSSDNSDVDFNVSYTLGGLQTFNISGNLTLFLNGAKNLTYKDGVAYVTNDTEYNLTVENMYDGIYIWNVLVENATTDHTSNTKYWAADNYTVTIDTTSPVVSISSPANNTNMTTDGFTVKGMANETNVDECYLRFNGANNQTVSYSNDTQFTFAGVSGFVDGENIDYTIVCKDLAGNTGEAKNRTINFDLGSLTIESNETNMTWFRSASGSHAINITIRDAQMIENCSLYGNWNRSGNVAGSWHLNETLSNATGQLVTDTQLNFTFNNLNNGKVLADTNSSADGMYRYNFQCCTYGHNCEWAFSVNRTLGVDTVAPTAPWILALTNDISNVTGTNRYLKNVTDTLVLTDSIPNILWEDVNDTNDVTLYVTADDTAALASPTNIITVSGTTDGAGTMTMANDANISLSYGTDPYTLYYIGINVTDDAGNWNSSSNDTSIAIHANWRISRYGANLTEDIWNPVGIARTQNINLSAVAEEAGADYVAIYNTSHEFVTCTSTSASTHACKINVSQGDVVWVYDSEDMHWAHSWWDVGSTLDPNMTSANFETRAFSSGKGYRLINLTWNMTSGGSRWNYLPILNWSDNGITIHDLQEHLNNTQAVGFGTTGATNLNNTGYASTTHNITFMSYHNISSNTYHPYYWAFGDPWNKTQLDFRSVIAVYLNHTQNAYLNRSGI